MIQEIRFKVPEKELPTDSTRLFCKLGELVRERISKKIKDFRIIKYSLYPCIDCNSYEIFALIYSEAV